MPYKNLTGVPMPGAAGDLGLTGMAQQQLTEEEKLARKKKILAAGMSNEFQTATQMLFGNRLAQTGGTGA
jgi:hypothetical protein